MNTLQQIANGKNRNLDVWKPVADEKLKDTSSADTSVSASNTQEKPVIQDKNEIIANREEPVDWLTMVQNYIDTLKSTYRNIQFSVASIQNQGQLKQYVASLGLGTHLVLSDRFIQQMSRDAQSFAQGKELLDEVAKKLSAMSQNNIGIGTYLDVDRATSWIAVPKNQNNPFEAQQNSFKNLLEMMEEARKNAEKRKEAFKVSVSSSTLNSAGEIFSRIAKAENVMSVKEVMIAAEQKIYSLKLVLSLGSEKDKKKAQAAIAQLERAIASGSTKIKSLEEEADILRRQKRAEMQLQERKAEQMKAELKRKQAARHSREHAQIGRDQWFDYHEEWLYRKKIAEAERELSPTGSIDPSVGMGGVGIEAGGAANVAISAADVTITASVEISM